VLASDAAITKMCLDKYETASAFRAHGIPFADTVLPSSFDGQWRDTVVKPREGRGSRGVHFNPPDCRAFDDSFVVQKRLVGPEITTAFYATAEGKLHGEITFERTLESGMTSRATVTFAHQRAVGELIAQIMRAFPVRGPCNVQSIVTEAGPIPFELNCRYSGTSSIRSQLGFEDVRYGVEEYLLGQPPSAAHVIPGSAIRIFVDIVYPNRSYDEIAPGPGTSYIF
jgi:carbamoyl-phosphate synthase large subunit